MKKTLFVLAVFLFGASSVFAEQMQKQKIVMEPIGVFACDCEFALNQAFNGFQNYIISSNLQPLLDNLVDLYNSIENTTAEIEAQQAEIQKSNNVYKEKIIELERYLYNLKKQKTILSTGESLTANSNTPSFDK